MSSTLLVWDIETTPDIDGYARAQELTGKASSQIRATLGDTFPKHIYHSIICIGALAAERTEHGWEIQAVDAKHVGDQTEKELIQSFVDFVAEHQPQMVTFNGHSFDLPVLRYRAMMHHVSAPGLHGRPYYHRFTEDAVDLCDVLSSFSFGGRATLHEISRVLGLPGKPDGIDGSQVETYYLSGRIQEIADYCQSDVVNTYRIWLRHELFRGRLTRDAFQFSDTAVVPI